MQIIHKKLMSMILPKILSHILYNTHLAWMASCSHGVIHEINDTWGRTHVSRTQVVTTSTRNHWVTCAPCHAFTSKQQCIPFWYRNQKSFVQHIYTRHTSPFQCRDYKENISCYSCFSWNIKRLITRCYDRSRVFIMVNFFPCVL